MIPHSRCKAKNIASCPALVASLVALLAPFCPLSAMLVGNPDQPHLQTQGIFQKAPSIASVRLGYFDDYVYHQAYIDEYVIAGQAQTLTNVKLSTYAGTVTLNFIDRIDLYGILGASRIKVDQEIIAKRRFSWGAGIKFVIYQEGNFCLGGDFKYFETSQKPTFFLSEDLAYNVIMDYRLDYAETQAAIGMSYKFWLLSPYINATYLSSSITPHPKTALVRYPFMDLAIDVPSSDVSNSSHWGMAVGMTLIDRATASLALEWRLFNQYAVNLNGEVRF